MGREVSKTRIAAPSLGMGRNAGNSVLMWRGVLGSWIKGHRGSGCGSGKGSMLGTLSSDIWDWWGWRKRCLFSSSNCFLQTKGGLCRSLSRTSLICNGWPYCRHQVLGTQFILDMWRGLHWVPQMPVIMRMPLLVDC